MEFAKYHALGNDYVVLEAAAWPALSAEQARRICDRHRGLGSDGILVRADSAQHALRIVNPDGSEAEKSGNGLRIFARYLFDRGLVGSEPFRVVTAGGAVTCVVAPGGRSVSVEMGRVRFDSEAIPVAGPPREVLRERIEVAGEALEFSAATIGNPHCVVLRDDVSEAAARRLGPLLEREPRFPRRTNVQFMAVRGRNRIQLEIWERGAGYTLASGTSSCAAAAACHRRGLVDREVTVAMPGGELAVTVGEGYAMRLRGPVEEVMSGDLSPDLIARLA